MGIFDLFRSKAAAEPIDRLRRIAPQIFPGGHDQIAGNGRKIAALLDNRIPADAGARIYASTKYLAHTSSDKSKARVVGYIVRQGMGRISEDEAGEIYDKFIDKRPQAQRSASEEAPQQGTIYINAQLVERSYLIANETSQAVINAAMFTTLLLGLRSEGWKGAAYLFVDESEMMKPIKGTILIRDADARYIAERLTILTSLRGKNNLLDRAVDVLIEFGGSGPYQLRA